MGPNKAPVTRKVLSIELKQEIIRKKEAGAKVTQLAIEYGVNKSTIGTILAKKDSILQSKVAKGISRIHSHKRGSIHDELERLLLVWINDRRLKGDVISRDIICEKAKAIFQELKQSNPGTGSLQEEEVEFKATRGWFNRFKKRHGLHTAIEHGEVDIDKKGETEKFLVDNLEVQEENQDEPTKDCQAPLEQEHKNGQTEVSSGDEKAKAKRPLSTTVIEDLLKKWEEVQIIVNAYHPNQAEVNRAADLYNESAMHYFRVFLKTRIDENICTASSNLPLPKKSKIEVSDEQLILSRPSEEIPKHSDSDD